MKIRIAMRLIGVAIWVTLLVWDCIACPTLAAPAVSQTNGARQCLDIFTELMGKSEYLKRISSIPQQELSRPGLTLQDMLNFAGLVNLPLRLKEFNLNEFRENGDNAVIELRKPDRYGVVAAIGLEYSLVYDSELPTIIKNTILANQPLGQALVLTRRVGQNVAARVEDPVRSVDVKTVGIPVVENFTITNRGILPLLLQVDSTSCGCTSADLSATSLLPGGTALLAVKVDTNSWGSRVVTVTLRTTDPLRPRLLVAIDLRMPKVVLPIPSRVTIHTREGHPAEALITVLLPGDVTIHQISAHHSFVTASTVGRTITEGGVAERLHLLISADAPPGSFTDDIVLDLKNAKVSQVVIPLDGLIEPDITASPPQIFLGFVAEAQSEKQMVTLESHSGHLFSINSVRTSSPGVVVTTELGVNSPRHQVQIQVRAKGVAGSIVSEQVELALSEGHSITLIITGLVKQEAQGLSATPATKEPIKEQSAKK